MSLEPIRRHYYQVFIWTHQLYVLYIIGSLLHYWQTFYFVLPAIALLLLDRWAPSSFGESADNTVFDADHDVYVSVPSHDIIKMKIVSRSTTPRMALAPGDWVKIKVQDVSAAEWHPYTVASYGPDNTNEAVIYIKAQAKGSWSAKLRDLALTSPKSSNGLTKVKAEFQGVFGHDGFGSEYMNYDRVLIVAGGSGVTPALPIVRELVADAYHKQRSNFSIHMAWVVRDVETALAFEEWVQMVTRDSVTAIVNFSLYVTNLSTEQTERLKNVVRDSGNL
jgi:NAD(P)H-flavin reductase